MELQAFPSSISVVWEAGFLVAGNWSVWAHGRSLDLAAPGQLGPTAALSLAQAPFVQPKERTPFLGTRLQSRM